MRISAWATVAAIGFAGSILAAGCVAGTDDGDDKDGGGAGGQGGSSGASGASGSSGRGGSSGSSGSGGSSGTAGTGGMAGNPNTCDPRSDDDVCDTCMKTNCCAELVACGKDAACAGTTGEGELSCINGCVLDATNDGGVADQATIGGCASQCAVGSTISDATNDAVACMANGVRADGGDGPDCLSQCLQGN